MLLVAPGPVPRKPPKFTHSWHLGDYSPSKGLSLVKKTLGCHGNRIFFCQSKHFHRNPNRCLPVQCPLLPHHAHLPPCL